MKKLIMGVVGASMALGLAACNDRDVAVGAAAVTAGFIAGSVYDHHHGWDYRHHRRGWDHGRYYWDRHDGRWERDGRGRWHRGAGWGGRHDDRWGRHDAGFETMAAVNSETAIASKYRLNARGAHDVMKTLKWVRTYGKFDAFREIGMTDADVLRLANGGAPGSTSIRNMADHLNASTASVNAMIQDLRDEQSLQSQNGYKLK